MERVDRGVEWSLKTSDTARTNSKRKDLISCSHCTVADCRENQGIKDRAEGRYKSRSVVDWKVIEKSEVRGESLEEAGRPAPSRWVVQLRV